MNDRIFYEIYNVATKERGVLQIEKGVDKATTAKLFYDQYGQDGWMLVGPLPHEGGK